MQKDTKLQLSFGNLNDNIDNIPVQDGNLTFKSVNSFNLNNNNEAVLAFLDDENQRLPLSVDADYLTLFSNSGYLHSDISLFDGCFSSSFNCNRFAFTNTNGIVIETSNDNGATWQTPYTADDAIALTSDIGSSIKIGGTDAPATESLINDKIRITLTPQKMGIYLRLMKLMASVENTGASHNSYSLSVEVSYANDKDNFVEYANKRGISGWTVVNFLYDNKFPGIAFGGNAATNIYSLRLTYSTLSYKDSNRLIVKNLWGFGSILWNNVYGINLIENNHLYKYDMNQNAIFPSEIYVNDDKNNKVLTASDTENFKIKWKEY